MKKPIRILHVIRSMNMAGSETMIMNLYRNIDRNKIQFDFLVDVDFDCDYDEEIKLMGGKIYRLPRFKLVNIIKYIFHCVKFFKEHKEFLVVHGHIGSTAPIYLSIAKLYGIPTIAHSHSEGRIINLKSIAYRLISYPTRFIADYFFACSYQAGVNRFGKGVVIKNSFSIWSNAIDFDVFKFNPRIREIVRDKFYLNNKLVIGHVGRLSLPKNHSFLLDIFNEIQKMKANSILLLVGEGELRLELMRKCEVLGLKDKVIFMGIEKDVSDILQAMDIFVFPSIYEGIPLSIIEAQASGLPIIASEAVPKEAVIIGGHAKRISLNKGEKYWAESILNFADIYSENNRGTDIDTFKFDVKLTAQQLEEFYLSIDKFD